jgi:hypothetical protein
MGDASGENAGRKSSRFEIALHMGGDFQEAGRFILQVVGKVRSAAEAMASVFQPSPVFSASYFTFLRAFKILGAGELG